MPKNKTHSGSAKRFKLTGTGKITRRQANRNHLLEHKPTRRTRRLATPHLAPSRPARNTPLNGCKECIRMPNPNASVKAIPLLDRGSGSVRSGCSRNPLSVRIS